MVSGEDYFLEKDQKRVLQLIAEDAPLSTVLDALIEMVERPATHGMLASILLLDEDGKCLRHGAAPSLPEAYNRAVDGIALGPYAGSCGTAAYRKEPVYVSDIGADPLWRDFAALADSAGLRACWSTPIMTADGRLLGTFAMYYPTTREANAYDLRLVGVATALAAIAIQRAQARDTLRAAEERQAYLLGLSDALRPLANPREIQMVATDRLRRHFGAGWSYYIEWNEAGTLGAVLADSVREGLPSLAGEHDVSDVPAFMELLHAGNPLNIPDFGNYPLFSPRIREQYTRMGLHSLLGVPLVKDGRLVALLVMADTEVRRWTRDAESLTQETAERTWSAVERARVEAALRESQAEAERERRLYQTIISSTPDLVYTFGLDYRFTFVNEALLEMWGRSLEDSIGKSLLEVGYEPWHAEMHEREIDQVVATRAPIRGEVAFPHATLGRRIYDYIFVPVTNSAGEVEAVAGTTRDVTERKQAEEALRAADRAKDNFLAMLGHELRNPLGAASNALHLMHARCKDAPDLQRPLDVLVRQLAHITRLVDDLLDVSRVTRGKVRIEKQPVTLNAVVEAAVRCLAPVAREKGVRLDFDGDRDVMVLGDPVRLEQVVTNLLDNAIKYTPAGEVQVSLRRRGEAAEIQVRDTGMGIAAETLPRVFDLFSQADDTLERSQGGLGIGLTVVKQLVEMHDGIVTAESQGPGKGSTFTVTLPLMEGQETPSADETPADPGDDKSSTAFRILVVDDNMDAADALVDILRMWGHDASAVYDGAAAVRAAREGRPDAVLLDIGLPEMDGYEVARRLREEPELAATRLIALTGYGQDADRQRAVEARFDSHMVKPVDLKALEQALAGI